MTGDRYKESKRSHRKYDLNINDESFSRGDESVFKQTLPKIKNIRENMDTSETNASYDFQGSMTNPMTGSRSTRNQVKRGNIENQSLHIKVEEANVQSMWDNGQLYDENTSLFTQRNHFEVMASNKARLKLELDLDFKNEMDNAMLNLERHPTVKNKVW